MIIKEWDGPTIQKEELNLSKIFLNGYIMVILRAVCVPGDTYEFTMLNSCAHWVDHAAGEVGVSMRRKTLELTLCHVSGLQDDIGTVELISNERIVGSGDYSLVKIKVVK